MIVHSNLKTRKTIDLSLEQIASEYPLERPELLRIRLETIRYPIDIGCIAYVKRDYYPSIETIKIGIPVDISSLLADRQKLILALVDFILLNDFRDLTVQAHIKNWKTIFRWCDQNNFESAFNSIQDAKSAFRSYSEYLKLKMHNKPMLSRNRAAEFQGAFRNMVTIRFGEIGAQSIASIPLIKSKKIEIKDAPEKSNIIYMFENLCAIARSFSDLYINHLPFPYKLIMPSWEAWVFPGTKNYFISPYCTMENLSYNYSEGRVNTIEEIIQKQLDMQRNKGVKPRRKVELTLAKRKAEATAVHLDAKKLIADANINKNHHSRLEFASLALQCYLQLFAYLTASNPSQIADILYDENYELEGDHFKRDFKSIKFRAGNKVVSYRLESKKGITIFKDFLKLRAEVLGKCSFKFLFFNLDRSSNPIKIDYKTITTGIYKRLRGKYIPEETPTVTFNDLRVNKTHILHHLKVPPDQIADLLQHSLAVSETVYSRTTAAEQNRELTNFWDSVRQIRIISSQRKATSGIAIPAGYCTDFQHPNPVAFEASITPDCKSQFGCLYCKHYAVHADEEDVRKLFNILYVATEIQNSSRNVSEADVIFGALRSKILGIIDVLKNRSSDFKELVDSVESDVFVNGELTSFWELKLQRFEELIIL